MYFPISDTENEEQHRRSAEHRARVLANEPRRRDGWHPGTVFCTDAEALPFLLTKAIRTAGRIRRFAESDINKGMGRLDTAYDTDSAGGTGNDPLAAALNELRNLLGRIRTSFEAAEQEAAEQADEERKQELAEQIQPLIEQLRKLAAQGRVGESQP